MIIRLINTVFLLLVGISINAQLFNYLPKDTTNNQKVSRTYYSLSYSERHEQPLWVAYMLTKDMVLTQNVKRTGNFRKDPEITTGSAKLVDYRSSGFDRGHLLPAGDMNFNHTAMSETFFMSNMSPQAPSFNRGIWSKLEALVRQWAVDNDTIYVVTAGVLEDGLPSIGRNRVSVPRYYYKVILDYTKPHIKAIGFILPNEGNSASLQSFALSVEEVENRTGINFFHNLPDELESVVESQLSLNQWTFTTTYQNQVRSSSNESPTTKNQNSSASSQTSQCLGIAKSSNKRCKKNTKNPNGYCHQHQSQVKR